MLSAIFKTFFLSLCIIANTSLAYAQTASILPQGKTQFLGNDGKPLASGTVDFYIPSTTTRKTTWQNSTETIANTNPVVLDAGGRALIYGDGAYRQVVKNRLGNVIWDQLTSSSGSGGGSSIITNGDGDLVGTIKPWAGMIAPNQYAFTYGQEISRTTYSAVFTAITSSQSIFCSSGSPVLTGLSDTTNFWIGMSLEASCVAAGFTTVISKTSTTVTMAANANVTTNITAIFYPWGRGNGTTTFNLPDFRGLVLSGNNNMGGVASSNLTTAYFGTTTPNSIGALGGSQSATLAAGNLPTHTHTSSTLTDPGHVHSVDVNSSGGGSDSVTQGAAGVGATVTGPINTNTTGITISASTGTNASGLSTAFSIVQPTRTSNYIIKIIPDTTTAISTASCLVFIDSGTACQANTGTSGHTVPFLDGNNIFSGTLNNLNITLAASPTTVDIQAGLSVASTAASFLANPSSSAGNTASTTIQGLNTVASLDVSLDYFLMYDHTSGQLRKATAAQIGASSGGVAGVSTLGGAAGGIALSDGLTITSGPTLTYSTPISTVTISGSVSGVEKIVLCDATAGSLAITIPAANSVVNGTSITVKRKDSTAANCSVAVSGGGTIDNQLIWGIAPQYASFTFTSDGSTQWWVN